MKSQSYRRRFNADPRPARSRKCTAGIPDRTSYFCERSEQLVKNKAPCKRTHVRAKAARRVDLAARPLA